MENVSGVTQDIWVSAYKGLRYQLCNTILCLCGEGTGCITAKAQGCDKGTFS